MANIVLFQTGNKSWNPRTGQFYDPWQSHIWLCLEQIRIWNPKIDIFMITDDVKVSSEENFEKFSIKREFISDLNTKYDLENLNYFNDSINPSERACGLRPFYIESIMRKYDLQEVFSFDNDVLIYSDLNELSKKISNNYSRVGLTPDSEERLVFGMFYVKNSEVFGEITDLFWDYMNSEIGRNLIDMGLWNIIYKQRGKDFIGNLPIWLDGLFSDFNVELGGIFDPSSIGQYLVGCDNGNPPGTLFPHHYIHRRLQEGIYRFRQSVDEIGRKYMFVENIKTNQICKILSIHVHNKKLSLLM